MTDYGFNPLSTSQTHLRCPFGAPLVAIAFGLKATISQSCCNHWECPICGVKRAKQEYRRIVEGAERLEREGHELYFWTITCRGRECSYAEALDNYLLWTNRLLTSARAKAKRAGDYWCYAQVTEHQKKTRQHPHSHLLTTFLPNDAKQTADQNGRPVYVSQWFSRANVSAGLGSQCSLSKVRSAAAVARYVGKYMFKESANEVWPTGWKRVRYSQNWPDVTPAVPDFVSVLLSKSDWHKLEREKMVFTCETPFIYELALHRIANIALPAKVGMTVE
jgi:hypothetical protein